jgi:hypothetical protein
MRSNGNIAEQMAMVSTNQKPKQRNRNGKVLEGLPGSTKSVACMERNVENLGGPKVPDDWMNQEKQVGRPKRQVGKPETNGSQISP